MKEKKTAKKGVVKNKAVKRKKTVKKEELSEELKTAIILNSSKLAILVAGLPVENDVKSAIFDLAENASFDQLEALRNTIEAVYLDAQTQEIDEQFRKDLEKLKAETDEEEKKITNAFMSKLKVIEDKILKHV